MAVTVGTAAATARLTFGYAGWSPKTGKTEPATNVLLIDGDYDNTELQTFLSYWDLLTLVGIPTINVSKDFVGTGQATAPTNSDATSLVSAGIVLVFNQANPLNAEKTISKSVFLPAPVTGLTSTYPFNIASDAGDNSSVDEKLRTCVTFLEDNMAYIDAAGDVHIGGWTLDISKSAYLTKPNIADGE